MRLVYCLLLVGCTASLSGCGISEIDERVVRQGERIARLERDLQALRQERQSLTMIEVGRTYTTRNGREVVVTEEDSRHDPFPMRGWVVEGGKLYSAGWTRYGCFWDNCKSTEYDLVVP